MPAARKKKPYVFFTSEAVEEERPRFRYKLKALKPKAPKREKRQAKEKREEEKKPAEKKYVDPYEKLRDLDQRLYNAWKAWDRELERWASEVRRLPGYQRGVHEDLTLLYRKRIGKLILDADSTDFLWRLLDHAKKSQSKLYEAFRDVWGANKAFLKATGSCMYVGRVPKFDEETLVTYRVCKDKYGLPTAERSEKSMPKKPEEPIFELPVEEPGKKPPVERKPADETCFEAGGATVCVRGKVARVDGDTYVVLDTRTFKSYGGNEIVYSDTIEAVKPFQPPLDSKRCTRQEKIYYVVEGEGGLPELIYTVDGKRCHAAFTVPQGKQITVYLLSPRDTSRFQPL